MELKFRGKAIGAGSGHHEMDWAYGNLVEELRTGKCFICDLSHFNDDTLFKDILIEVDPKTVGQYTRQNDINGKEVYSGDVVEKRFMNLVDGAEFVGKVEFCDGSWIIENGKEAYLLFHEIDEIEVLGNIHDGHVLLKKPASTVKRYKTKPCDVDAIQWNEKNLEEVLEFGLGKISYNKVFGGNGNVLGHILNLSTLDGNVVVSKGEYIVKGDRGEFYLCQPRIFKNKYEEVQE